jgi:5-methylthioadenosine/S-adenosylhomocysteine deaminase
MSAPFGREKRTLIKDVDVVTLDAKGTILPRCDLAIAGARIVAVGAPPADFVPDEIIDGYNHAALPGFFNAHCHAAMTMQRGWAEDLPLDRWFNERIWVAESALTSDDVYWGAALAACEMLRSGCVAFNDHYFYMDRVAEVVAQSGMKAALTWCQFGIGANKEVGTDLAGALRFARTYQGAAQGRIRTLLGPHSPYICPPAFLREISALAREHAMALHIHLAESAEQVSNSLRAHGMSPTALLQACGVFDVPCIAAHALYVDDADIAILARHEVTVAHCPITYMKLGMGVPDLGRLLAAGVQVALGTDGPGSNNDMDMKAAVRFAPLLQKYRSSNAEALAGDLPLRMAATHGARALGFADSGVLAAGRTADLILIDLDQPHLYPRHNLVANLVHAARGSDVTHVFVDGKLLMKGRELLTLDVQKIQHEAERHARRMVSQNLRIVREYQG